MRITEYPAPNRAKWFLPYQRAFIADPAPLIYCVKSRRIGMTVATAFKAIRWCLTDGAAGKREKKVHFSSADITATNEFIETCADFLKVFNAGFDDGNEIIDEEKGITARVLRLANGYKIYGHSSNPKNFRSKGGFVILDEFPWHEDQEKLWAAAQASAVVWGYPAVILGSFNGASNFAYRLYKEIEEGKRPQWHLYFITIDDAIAMELVEKIRLSPDEWRKGIVLSAKERAVWRKTIEETAVDRDTFAQEFLCIPQNEAAVILSYELLARCGDRTVLWRDPSIEPLRDYDGKTLTAPDDPASAAWAPIIQRFQSWYLTQPVAGWLHLGVDLAREGHRTVFWLGEKIGRSILTRLVLSLKRTPFWAQRMLLSTLVSHHRFARACIDETGLGKQLAEEALYEHGARRIEKCTFTNQFKEILALDLKDCFERRNIIIPDDDPLIADDLHSVRRSVTAAGNTRYDARTTDRLGHGDFFWAAALAWHSAKEFGEISEIPRIRRGNRLRMKFEGYE